MKKKALLLMLFLVFIATNVLSQETIYGTVSGDVQEGVTVEINKIDCGATNPIAELTTDSDGNYSSLSLEDGRYWVIASKDGYTVSPNLHNVQIPQTVPQSYVFTASNNPCASVDRFLDNGDGTVTDCRTGLGWLQNANCFGEQFWDNAISAAAGLNSGECGLTDGSVEGDWRLPTKEELQGIGTDPPATWYERYPSVPWTIPGSPFFSVLQSGRYWSGTEYEDFYIAVVWSLDIDTGNTIRSSSDYHTLCTWPVRSDN